MVSRPPNAAELAQQQANFDDRLCTYLKVETVENLLRNQFLAAFEEDYLTALVMLTT